VHRDHYLPVSAEAVSLWRRCRELERQGRRDEWLTAGKQLCAALGHSWLSMVWPTNVGTEPPGYFHAPERRWLLEEWCKVRAWADALAGADREQPSEQRH